MGNIAGIGIGIDGIGIGCHAKVGIAGGKGTDIDVIVNSCNKIAEFTCSVGMQTLIT